MNMDRSNLGGNFLSGSNCRILDIEMPMEKLQQGQMGHPMISHQSLDLNPMKMMSGIEGGNGLGFFEAKGLSLNPMSMDLGKGKGISLGRSPSNNTSDDEELEDFNGENCDIGKDKKESRWQRMKWTDNSVRLLIAVVASVGDDGIIEPKDGIKRKSGVLQKKGKWKMVSNVMISNGCCVSPQQCEDKFNDLNKRYKKLNDIFGRGISCQVVETPSLMDSIPHLTEKSKDEVKKILSSKHLFYREMCAFHNGQQIPGCHDIDLQAHLLPVGHHQNENNCSEMHEDDENDDSESDDDSYEENVKNIDIKFEPNFGKSLREQKTSIQSRLMELEEEKVKLEIEALGLEKERLKWLRYKSKKDRQLERLRLENERMRLENDRMVMMVKQKEIEISFLQKSGT